MSKIYTLKTPLTSVETLNELEIKIELLKAYKKMLEGMAFAN